MRNTYNKNQASRSDRSLSPGYLAMSAPATRADMMPATLSGFRCPPSSTVDEQIERVCKPFSRPHPRHRVVSLPLTSAAPTLSTPTCTPSAHRHLHHTTPQTHHHPSQPQPHIVQFSHTLIESLPPSVTHSSAASTTVRPHQSHSSSALNLHSRASHKTRVALGSRWY